MPKRKRMDKYYLDRATKALAERPIRHGKDATMADLFHPRELFDFASTVISAVEDQLEAEGNAAVDWITPDSCPPNQMVLFLVNDQTRALGVLVELGSGERQYQLERAGRKRLADDEKVVAWRQA